MCAGCRDVIMDASIFISEALVKSCVKKGSFEEKLSLEKILIFQEESNV